MSRRVLAFISVSVAILGVSIIGICQARIILGRRKAHNEAVEANRHLYVPPPKYSRSASCDRDSPAGKFLFTSPDEFVARPNEGGDIVITEGDVNCLLAQLILQNGPGEFADMRPDGVIQEMAVRFVPGMVITYISVRRAVPEDASDPYLYLHPIPPQVAVMATVRLQYMPYREWHLRRDSRRVGTYSCFGGLEDCASARWVPKQLYQGFRLSWLLYRRTLTKYPRAVSITEGQILIKPSGAPEKADPSYQGWGSDRM